MRALPGLQPSSTMALARLPAIPHPSLAAAAPGCSAAATDAMLLSAHPCAGTGKTLIARACAAQTQATFLKLAGPSLVQMFIGDGAKMVRTQFSAS